MKYPRATVTKKSGVRNLQACVTVPLELRDIVGRKQIYKALGTNDPKIAIAVIIEHENQALNVAKVVFDYFFSKSHQTPHSKTPPIKA